MYADSLYVLLVLPGFVLAMIATFLTRSTFGRYARVAASSGMSGAEAARALLDAEGLAGVSIERTQGFLSDHYDPRDRTLRLSPDVYQGRSLSAVGVACHEAGHALQHAQKYGPLSLRSTLVPATQFGSRLAIPLLIAGFALGFPFLAKVGIVLFAVTVFFTLVTLPVEWDASSRAKRLMVSSGIVTPSEQGQAAAVLNAAFLTYVASAVSAVLTLLYYLVRAGVLGRRR